MSRIETFEETKSGWTEWLEPSEKKFRMVCCDCGLVHDLEFDAYKLAVDGPFHIIFRARRNNRSTGQIRRRRKG